MNKIKLRVLFAVSVSCNIKKRSILAESFVICKLKDGGVDGQNREFSWFDFSQAAFIFPDCHFVLDPLLSFVVQQFDQEFAIRTFNWRNKTSTQYISKVINTSLIQNKARRTSKEIADKDIRCCGGYRKGEPTP